MLHPARAFPAEDAATTVSPTATSCSTASPLTDGCMFADPVDPTIEFLYKPHSLLALVTVLIGLVYYAFSAPLEHSSSFGWLAMIGIFMFFGMLAFKDGPFIRPHPAFWRLVLAASLVYQMLLTFALFQNVDWTRRILGAIDPETLGVPPPERSYAEDCSVTWFNLMGKMDEFVIAHALGWLCKAIIIRDYWFCWILSIMFELCEYSLEHQLPNFAECWWDHWILDVLLCNWLGTYLGMRICAYFEMKQYSWRGFKEISGMRAKVKRAVAQFSPHSWNRFHWGATQSFKNYVAVIALLVAFLACELNAFYLKFILWVPASHRFNMYRLALYFLASIPATRELYQYVSDASCRRIGVQAWVLIVSICTETLICVKFGKGMFPAAWPTHVVVFWTLLAALLIIYPAVKFAVPELRKRRRLRCCRRSSQEIDSAVKKDN